MVFFFLFFFQAEDGIRDLTVTGVQTCALPISVGRLGRQRPSPADYVTVAGARGGEIAAGGSPPEGARVAYAPARSFAARLRPFRNARRWSRRRRHLRRSG